MRAPVLPSAPTRSPNAPRPHWTSAALPLGSLIFSIHNLLAESSTLVAWSWTGYENGVPRGPLPHVHSALTILAQCLGLAFALYGFTGSVLDDNPGSQTSVGATENGKDGAQRGTTTSNPIRALILSPHYFAFGATSMYVLYAHKNWAGYIGGLGVAFFLMSIIPTTFERVVAITKIDSGTPRNLGKTLGTAFVVYCLLILASIFTVAYAFIPGGVYFRERTDL